MSLIEQYFAQIKRRSNICFDCDLACGGCSWSELDPETGVPRFEPVPGWTAKSVILQGNQTYHITACPLFKPDPMGRTEEQDGTDRAYDGLSAFYEEDYDD